MRRVARGGALRPIPPDTGHAYQQAREVARLSGVSSENILPLAAIYRVTELAEQRIRADTALSAEEKTGRLQAARLAQENSLRRLLGEEAYQRYMKSQNP